MAYKLEHAVKDHQDTLQETLLDWSKDDHDIYLVSDEGHKIFTQKILLYFYSNTLGTILDSLPPSTTTPGISVSASSSSISNLLKLLTTGQVASNNKDALVNVKEASKALGINLSNCLLEAKNNLSATIIRKLPAKTDVFSSTPPGPASQTMLMRKLPAKSEPQVSPANLSVFRNRESGLGGIAKWNTVITAKNKIIQVPGPAEVNAKDVINEETKENDDEESFLGELKLACEFCGAVFASKRNLKRHKLNKHPNGSNKEGAGSGEYVVKVENHESGALKLQCNNCDREFDSEHKLNKHALQHTNRYSCDQCDKSFQSSSTLKNHKNIHLDEKPFKCEICDKEFTQAGNLKTHKIKHHGDVDSKLNSSTVSMTPDVSGSEDETPTTSDKCGYCEEHFGDSSELNSHMVMMHSIQEPVLS